FFRPDSFGNRRSSAVLRITRQVGFGGPKNSVKRTSPNVNVTPLDPRWYEGRAFPCPICGAGLRLRAARTLKPYCHCDSCGIQLFFRGRAGIERLKNLLSSGVLTSNISRAGVLLNRIEQLKEQQSKLKDRQGFFFPDQDLESAIEAF